MCSYKIIGLKVLWNEYLQKNRGGGSVPSRPGSLAGLGFKTGFLRICLVGPEEIAATLDSQFLTPNGKLYFAFLKIDGIALFRGTH